VSDIYFGSAGRNYNESGGFNLKEFDVKKYESAYKMESKGLISTLGSSTYSADKVS
jgi:hypothetical protein